MVTEAAQLDEQGSRGGYGGNAGRPPRRARRRWLAYVPLLFALGAIAALLVYADPRKIGVAFERFNLEYVPVVVVLGVGFYVVQGVRWWTLNRALHIRFPLRDTVFLTETGQATALLPLGELTRALLLSKAAGVHLGAVVATETVQELLFVFMLFALALPKAIGLHYVAIAVVVPMLFVIAIVAILTIEGLYTRVRRMRPDLVTEYETMTGRPIEEMLPEKDFEYIHYATARNDISMLENLGGEIAEVAGRRVDLGAFPWRWQGGEGCICRVAAFVEE